MSVMTRMASCIKPLIKSAKTPDERQKYQELFQPEGKTPSSSTKEGFYPGPLTLARFVSGFISKKAVPPHQVLPSNRAQSTAAESDIRPRGRSQSPSKRATSPEKLVASSVSTIPRLPTLKETTKLADSNKVNGRKRLFMDPRDDTSTHGNSILENTVEDKTAALALPKRQRVNTWGTDAPTVNVRPIPELFSLNKCTDGAF